MQSSTNTNIGWHTADEILARIKAPEFPDREFSIIDFGAVPGGEINCSKAIRDAIEACSKAGGGRVKVPAGTFLTANIYLKSNVNLHLEEGSTLLFSTNPKDYLPVVFARWEGIECMNYSPLFYAMNEENIAVTGKGTLDGGASVENWWAWKRPSQADAKLQNEMSDKNIPVEQRIFGDSHLLRPNFFEPHSCRNVMIEGVTILRSPMWEINPVLCTNVIVRGVTINCHGPNNDGCDPESCCDVLVEDCIFDCGDDCIAIKAGRNDDGRRVGVPCENLIIRNCTMKDGHGGVSIGSEISGGCRNVFIDNCLMDSRNLSRVIRFKSNARRGGTIENIFLRNIKIGQVGESVVTIDFLYEEGSNGKFHPTVRNVFMENLTSEASPRLFFVRGYEGATIDNIQMKNCSFTGVTSTEVIQNAGRFVFDNVTIKPAVEVRSLHSRGNPDTPEGAKHW